MFALLVPSFLEQVSLMALSDLLQGCSQASVHALIAQSKLQRNLQVATISISTNLLISMLSWLNFADKNTAKQLILFGSIFISENLPGKYRNQQIRN